MVQIAQFEHLSEIHIYGQYTTRPSLETIFTEEGGGVTMSEKRSPSLSLQDFCLVLKAYPNTQSKSENNGMLF